ncbi:putative thiosulfate sulfurtransferase, mitochondrial [Pieris rapae]|uniref:Thiosulfate sulfurtransferase 1 n=1 Tax=Pieris rapae TaxID=64459 RepID=A0A345BJE4_PIERA|nr:putative thiosulfate sulfurtransferase, mitochondrial [Pieris rapae]AXF50550.1 thiosulfate sulfurtransferase 1 [Pieris rapae]
MIGRILSRRTLATSYQVLKILSNQSFISSTRNGSLQSFNYPTLKNSLVRTYAEQVKVEDVTVDFEYVNKAINNRNILIIDVREPDEIKEHGKIPNSINIPLGNVTPVLSTMPENEFAKQYNKEKPSDDSEIIFYCMIGKRSGMAQQNAINLGYKNAKNYVGSYTDWASKTQ